MSTDSKLTVKQKGERGIEYERECKSGSKVSVKDGHVVIYYSCWFIYLSHNGFMGCIKLFRTLFFVVPFYWSIVLNVVMYYGLRKNNLHRLTSNQSGILILINITCLMMFLFNLIQLVVSIMHLFYLIYLIHT